MEQAIITLVSAVLIVTLHLDRARRHDGARLRNDMNEGFAAQTAATDALRTELKADMATQAASTDALRAELKADMATQRQELNDRIESSARRTDNRIKELNRSANQLNRSVIELAKSVGRAEGRTEVLTAVE